MKLRSILLRNFKSFGDGGGTGVEIPLARINYLIGRNGAGKSNVLEGLENIAVVLGGSTYTPDSTDYFDDDVGRPMELGVTVELSGEERMHFLSLSRTKSDEVVQGRLPDKPIYRFVRHAVEYVDGDKRHEKVSATVQDGSFHMLAEAHADGDRCDIEVKDLKMVDLISMSLPEPSFDSMAKFPITSEFLSLVDPYLYAYMAVLFAGRRALGTARKIAESVEADGDRCDIEVKDLKMVDLISMSLPEPSFDSMAKFPITSEFLSLVDPYLYAYMAVLFAGRRALGTARKIAESVEAVETSDVSADGRNLPNELQCAGRGGQAKFDRYMEPVTHGSPESIEPILRGNRFVLETSEPCLDNRREHKDLGSGEEQSLILCWHLFKAPGTILAIKEPELHLHAERQKEIRRLIQNADPGLQFIIETHSPVFLGAGEDETVLLTTKSGGQTAVARIAPENMGLIREELGISHADALYNANVLFVEGESEFRAFPMFWEELQLGPSPPPACFSLGGAGGAKRLRPLLEYLASDGRRFFVVLDGHGDAESHVRKLQRDKLLGDNVRLLPKSFEDEFASVHIMDAVSRTASEAGVPAPRLTAAELDAARAGTAAVVDVVKKRWFEETGSGLNKVSLARHLGSLPRAGIPPGIADALGAAARHFGAGGGARRGAATAPSGGAA